MFAARWLWERLLLEYYAEHNSIFALAEQLIAEGRTCDWLTEFVVWRRRWGDAIGIRTRLPKCARGACFWLRGSESWSG